MSTINRTYDDMILETIDGHVLLETPLCAACGHLGTVTVTEAELEALQSGAPIHDALSAYDRPYREQIISGYHPACWDALFGE